MSNLTTAKDLLNKFGSDDCDLMEDIWCEYSEWREYSEPRALFVCVQGGIFYLLEAMGDSYANECEDVSKFKISAEP